MVSPTARITPTRLPWWWPMLAVWLLMALWSPAFAGEVDAHALQPGHPAVAHAAWGSRAATGVARNGADDALRAGGWQLLSMPQMWDAVKQRSGSGAPRLLPLAVMPTQRGAWWVGVSASRAAGARMELRFTMPLDGSRVMLPQDRDD